MKCEKFHCQTILRQSEFPKKAKINTSNSFYESKKAVNLPFNLMSRRTLQIWHIFCHTVRYIYNNHIDENLLFCQPLYGRTKGMDIFQKVNDFFAKVRLLWTDCVSVCTDGTAVMTRHAAGFCTRVRSATDTPITFTHCMIHREALVA